MIRTIIGTFTDAGRDVARDHQPGSRHVERRYYLTDAEMSARFGAIPCLDGLRAISILLVLFSHFVSAIFPGGFGVLVFFVISGFLITRLLFAELKARERVSLRNFYIRRFLRLYPAIGVYTVVIVALFYFRQAPIHWPEPASALFYFANYLYAGFSIEGKEGGTMPFSIFWSLSVEEHFYILFPAVFVAAHGNPKRLATVLVAVCIGALALRLIGAAVFPERLQTLYFMYETQFRLDSLAVGVLVAVLCEANRGRDLVRRLARPLPIAIAAAVLLLCFAIRDPWFRETLRYTLQSAAVAVILIGILFSGRNTVVNRMLNLPIATWIGRLSYSLYVWHLVPLPFLDGLLSGKEEVAVARVVFSIAFAALSYYCLEQPLIGLRHRFGSVR
ncbi:MAG: acyltransferase [Betaproteobacteria bacterium]|nr:acyltransferase [Betaproteobacteria bacterium]